MNKCKQILHRLYLKMVAKMAHFNINNTNIISRITTAALRERLGISSCMTSCEMAD